jgi:hypothetical protein
MFEEANAREAARKEFKAIAREGAPTPAHPEVVLKVRELWLRNRETITKEGVDPAAWKQAVMRDTLSMLSSDGVLQAEGLPDMDEEGVEKILREYFGIVA